jgi:hypothetical protein
MQLTTVESRARESGIRETRNGSQAYRTIQFCLEEVRDLDESRDKEPKFFAQQARSGA